MIFIALFEMALITGVVLVISYLLLLPLQLGIKPKGPNRYGPKSSTRHIGDALSNAFRHTFDFSGRANLLDFWVLALFVAGMCFTAFVPFVIAVVFWQTDAWPWISGLLVLLPLLAVPSLSMAVRRLHDVNRSGWWLLTLLLLGFLNLLYWFVQPSQPDAWEKVAVFD